VDVNITLFKKVEAKTIKTITDAIKFEDDQDKLCSYKNDTGNRK